MWRRLSPAATDAPCSDVLFQVNCVFMEFKSWFHRQSPILFQPPAASPLQDSLQVPLTFQAVFLSQNQMASASGPCLAPPIAYIWFFWKALIDPLLPQVGHSAGAPLICFPQCSTDSHLSPLTLQEVASVLVLSNFVEIFTLWLKEGDRQTLPYMSTHFIRLGVHIYYTTLWGHKWCRYPH